MLSVLREKYNEQRLQRLGSECRRDQRSRGLRTIRGLRGSTQAGPNLGVVAIWVPSQMPGGYPTLLGEWVGLHLLILVGSIGVGLLGVFRAAI